MIQVKDIKPDYDRLKEYNIFQHDENYSYTIDCCYNDLDKIKGFNEGAFEKLIIENKLEQNMSDLYIYAGYYIWSWKLIKEDAENIKNNTEAPYLHFSDDLYRLIKFLDENKAINKIKFTTANNKDITISARWLVEDIEKIIKPYLNKNNLNAESIKNTKWKFHASGQYSQYRSPYKRFAESLVDIFKYLRTETIFKDKDSIISRNFIGEFLELLEIDTQTFSKTFETSYLVDKFK